MDWIKRAQDRDILRSVVEIAGSLVVPQTSRNLMATGGTTGFSGLLIVEFIVLWRNRTLSDKESKRL